MAAVETIIANVFAPVITSLVAWLTVRRKQNAESTNLEAAAYAALVEPLKSTIKCLEDRILRVEEENKSIRQQNYELLCQVRTLRQENADLKELVENFKRGRVPKKNS